MARPSYLIAVNKGEARGSLALSFLVMMNGRETFIELELRGPDVTKLVADLGSARIHPEPSEN